MKIGVCGDNCQACPRFRATKDGSAERLAEVARLWLQLGLRDHIVSDDEIKCNGCHPENRCAYQEQRDCAFGRKLPNCGMCERYPCQLVERSFQRTDAWRRTIGNCREFVLVEEAFFRKKENLDKVNLEKRANFLGACPSNTQKTFAN